jgi:hypothetical protein
MSSTALNTNIQIQKRFSLMRRFELLKPTAGAAVAARMVGISMPTLWRWGKGFKKSGLAGLAPKYANCGRRSPLAGVRLSAKAIRQIEQCTLESGSVWAGWKQFAKTGECPPVVAKLIQRSLRMPPFLKRIANMRPLQCKCWLAADGRRLLVKLPAKTTN